jgi:hypothetical protein
MPKQVLRFGICDDRGHRAATWALSAQSSARKSDIYLACRSLGGAFKMSLHDSGNWHIAYTKEYFEMAVKGAIPQHNDRFLEKWSRPPETALGLTLAVRILTPASAVTTPIESTREKNVVWLQNAPTSKATEIDILISAPETRVTSWPGKNSMGTELVGFLTLARGDTVWVVYRVVHVPNYQNLGGRGPYYYRNRTKGELNSKHLRAMAFGNATDGSRIIYDCRVVHSSGVGRLPRSSTGV